MNAKNLSPAVQPYLFFDGRCEEALEFYKRALDAQITRLLRFKDSPESQQCSQEKPSPDKIMHAEFRIGETELMASDGFCKGNPQFEGFSLSLTVPTEAEAERFFAALADKGQIRMPLDKTFFAARFGMVADQFGVGWMILARTTPK